MKPAILILAALASASAEPTRIKDLVAIEGVRDNQLFGYGLVVGLRGTGDTQLTLFSTQSLADLLQRMGVNINPTQMQVRDVAAVMVTATLPAFAQPGTKIDVTASAIGDAKSLQGGVLLLTPLKAADGQTYAAAQGPVVTGGFIAGGAGNSTVVNHPTVGRTPEGGIVERAPPSIAPAGHFKLQLLHADFITAARIADALNKHYAQKDPVARADSPAVISIVVPPSFASRTVEFVADLESLSVESDRPAKVVINERTGTIVAGNDIRISPASIMHGPLTVEIRTKLEVSQPAPLSQGQTMLVPQTAVKAKEAPVKNIILDKGATVEELVRALQAIGSTARDVIAILENLRAAGALEADIEVI
ncbi:MAG TPA: flagellar basal body P-ring protein FlgI [Bryobacteraceae bacterium]|nr:flagellar basal body P-ring protein FlgI [Bryobacteraceae bacterium]